MSKLQLTFAAENSDRIRPLLDGRVQVEGIDLNYIPLEPEEAFWRMTQFLEFDVSEMSGTAYLIERSRPQPRFIAIPAFLSRMFRHNAIYVHERAGIRRPEDLRGRKVGLAEYNLTANVWIRGLLQHEYGVHPREILWYVGGQEQPGRKERAAVPLPPDIRLEAIPPHETLNAMLARGDLDALIGPRMPPQVARGEPGVRRLFDDPWSVEEEYYRRTRIFPIMHVVVIRQDVYERHPWVAESLYKALRRAKDLALEAMYHTPALRVSLPWLLRELERTYQVMGTRDIFPYGVEASRPTLEAMVQYHVEQGLIPQALPLESLFAPSTLDEFRI
ncbi:MAG TPA: ABC transporter substrate-binding protein [Chloroflexota bacterium]|jgi:4,5-dihydroxyphthalate decarboxylase|nr:ABC transporter substrate-binding protein [Chloroflexota bacterium]